MVRRQVSLRNRLEKIGDVALYRLRYVDVLGAPDHLQLLPAHESRLAEALSHQPGQLSGGEQQRVAIARAMANEPRILLADEPTGNLDPATSRAVFQNLYELATATGVGVLIATHNMELARHMQRVVAIKDGRLVQQ